MAIKRYFKPAQTADKRNYATVRYLRNGSAQRHQMPQEGLYTESEMAKIDASRVPGEWVELDSRDTAFIFGLRQHCPRQIAAYAVKTFIVQARFEPGGKLVNIGDWWKARTAANAIIQAARQHQAAIEFIATPKGK